MDAIGFAFKGECEGSGGANSNYLYSLNFRRGGGAQQSKLVGCRVYRYRYTDIDVSSKDPSLSLLN